LALDIHHMLALEDLKGFFVGLGRMSGHNLHQFLRRGVVHGALNYEETAPFFGQRLFDDLTHFIEEPGKGGTLRVHGRLSRGLGKRAVVVPDAPETPQTYHGRFPPPVKRRPGVAHIDNLVRVGDHTVYLHLLAPRGFPEKDQVLSVFGVVIIESARPEAVCQIFTDDRAQLLGGPLAVKAHGTHQPNVGLVNTELIELFKDNLYGYTTKTGLPLHRDEPDGVIEGYGDFGLRADQFGQRLMVDR
jgi:hypothetical protein